MEKKDFDKTKIMAIMSHTTIISKKVYEIYGFNKVSVVSCYFDMLETLSNILKTDEIDCNLSLSFVSKMFDVKDNEWESIKAILIFIENNAEDFINEAQVLTDKEIGDIQNLLLEI